MKHYTKTDEVYTLAEGFNHTFLLWDVATLNCIQLNIHQICGNAWTHFIRPKSAQSADPRDWTRTTQQLRCFHWRTIVNKMASLLSDFIAAGQLPFWMSKKYSNMKSVHSDCPDRFDGDFNNFGLRVSFLATKKKQFDVYLFANHKLIIQKQNAD